MRWPETVPILKTADICKQSYDGPNDTHCLMGWRRVVFGTKRYGIDLNLQRRIWQIHGALAEAIAEVAPNFVDYVPSTILRFNDQASLIVDFNDRKPKRDTARVWNLAMAKLGYTVGNPEAKQCRKRKKN